MSECRMCFTSACARSLAKGRSQAIIPLRRERNVSAPHTLFYGQDGGAGAPLPKRLSIMPPPLSYGSYQGG
jgi:hypothetical protein